ncbi:AMP-dependent synthetase, partial [candidate division KSB1 bacterium 4572_119]
MIEFDPTLVHEWLSRSARRFPDKEALIFGEERWTYKNLEQHAWHLAASLNKAGLKRQDRVVIFLDNCTEAVISIYAILKAGGIFVTLEGSLKAGKLKYILQNCSPKVIITHTKKARIVNEALKDSDIKCQIFWVGKQEKIPDDLAFCSFSWENIFSTINKNKRINTSPLPRCIDVDLAALIYTSGSTGQAKGVMTTHHNMISAARSIIQYLDNSEDDIVFNVLPLSFDYGLYQIIMTFMFGGTVVLFNSFLYMHQVLEIITREKVTGFPVVPTIVAMLLQMQNLKKYDFSKLKYISNTAAALPVEHIRKLQNLFPGIKIYSMYGLTECKRVSFLPPQELTKKPSSVGKAMNNCEVFVVDKEGNEVEAGQEGELVIRGSNVMQGYWNDPVLTDETYRQGSYPEDRMLHSGDYFKKDNEGFLYFFGRKDDIIKSRGEKVSARE